MNDNGQGNVVALGAVTSLDIPPDRILAAALTQGLQQVVIMGYDADGDEYFASSVADGGDVLWLMEKLKIQLLNSEK